MHARVESLSAPKGGSSAAEYEDSFQVAFWGWHPRKGGALRCRCRCAVADGATESSYSAFWADLLVGAAMRGDLAHKAIPASLPALQQEWRKHVEGRPLAWFAEEKVRDGAFAAVLGLDLKAYSGRDRGTWDAVAVGDCCLVQLRGDEVLASFPFASAEEFTSRPVLLGSQTDPSEAEAIIRRRSGECEPGDVFLLMTDAIAAWFLSRACGDGRPPLGRLRDLVDAPDAQAQFTAFVEAERSAGGLRNDDTTLLWAELF
jgi:hypothetical protein